MLELSKALQAKAIVLNSTTIDSPTGRVNAKGEAIRPTLYFNKPATVKDDKGKDKFVPSKKSTLYTPNAIEAAKLNANVDIVETVKVNGVQFRFLKSTLDSSEISEIRKVKGMLKANDTILKLKAAVKAATSAYIMGLDYDSRVMVADAMATMVAPALDTLRGNSVDDELEPLFS